MRAVFSRGNAPPARGQQFKAVPRLPDFASTLPRRNVYIKPRVRTVPPILDIRPLDTFIMSTPNGIAQIPGTIKRPYVFSSPLVEVS